MVQGHVKARCDREQLCHVPLPTSAFRHCLQSVSAGSNYRHHLANVDTPTAQQIQDGLYVDNLITTVDSADEATAFYKEAKSTFQQCSMNIHDWQSYSQSIMEQIPDKDPLRSTPASILGLKWDSAQNVLSINSPAQSISEPTKRTVLHQVASVYDPLGLCLPTTLQGKQFLRRLCDSGYVWDASLHTELLPEWSNLQSTLQKLSILRIPRFIGPITKSQTLELHVFADASQYTYAAAIYVQSMHNGQPVPTNLVCARSRLAPQSKSKETNMTIPRLELMGAVIGAKTAKFVNN